MGKGTSRWRVTVDLWVQEELRKPLARAGAQVVRKLIEDAARQIRRVEAGTAYKPEASLVAALANIAAAKLVIDYMIRLHDNRIEVDIEGLVAEISSALDALNDAVEVLRDEA